MSVTAMHGFGTTLTCDLDGSGGGGSAVSVGNVRSISIDGPSVDLVEASHHGSSNAIRQKLAGIVRLAELTIELLWDPHDDTSSGTFEHHEILQTIASRPNGTAVPGWVITFPDSSTYTFTGRVTKFSGVVPFNDVMTATLTIKLSSAITVG